MRRSLCALAAAGFLLGLTACGDDDDTASTTEAADITTGGSTDISIDDETLETLDETLETLDETLESIDITLPSDLSIPELSGECLDIAQSWGTLITGVFAGDKESVDNLDTALDDLQDKAPDELDDDFEVVSEGFSSWAEVLADHDYNIVEVMSDEDARKELEALSTPEFEEASNNISAWLEEECSVS